MGWSIETAHISRQISHPFFFFFVSRVLFTSLFPPFLFDLKLELAFIKCFFCCFFPPLTLCEHLSFFFFSLHCSHAARHQAAGGTLSLLLRLQRSHAWLHWRPRQHHSLLTYTTELPQRLSPSHTGLVFCRWHADAADAGVGAGHASRCSHVFGSQQRHPQRRCTRRCFHCGVPGWVDGHVRPRLCGGDAATAAAAAPPPPTCAAAPAAERSTPLPPPHSSASVSSAGGQFCDRRSYGRWRQEV